MGYKCDVCEKDEGVVFCFADQAVMCQGCDHRVHSANKLVKKHERVALEKEAEPATCDICQEHKAIMFCAEDRALICRRCDLMIHTANEFTSKHHRYLLFGMAVGLKALGESNAEASGSDAGTSTATEHGTVERIERVNKETPYSLRNGGGASSSARAIKEEPWRSSTDRASWRAGKPIRGGGPEEQASLANGGLTKAGGANGSGSGLSSKPSSGNLLERPRHGMGHSPSLGALTGASLLTPFGTAAEQAQEPQEQDGDDSGSGQGASTSAAAGGATGGWGLDSMLRGNSDFTLAAELLGVPTVSQGFSAKDIDAAYIFDDDVDLDANLSALLEVPDLDFLQHDPSILFPNSSTRPSSNTAGYENSRAMNGKAGPDTYSADGVVPDMGMGTKRQRVI